MIAGLGLAALQLGQGFLSFNAQRRQAKQIKRNAKVMSQDLRTRRDNLLAARHANAVRETKMSSAKTAALVNQFAVSGIEFNGDAAQYVANVAAMDELNKQQATQDAYYNAELIDVQRRNLMAGAVNTADAMERSAYTSLLSSGVQSFGTFQDTTNYWEKYGPQKQNPMTTAGALGGAGVSFLGTQEGVTEGSFLGTQEGKISIIER